MSIDQEAFDKAIKPHLEVLAVQITHHVWDIADDLEVHKLGRAKSAEAQAEVRRQFLSAVVETCSKEKEP